MAETYFDKLHPIVDDGAIAINKSGQTIVYVLEGPYADAVTAQKSIPTGSAYNPPSGSSTPSPDYRVLSTDLQRKPGGYAILRITCAPIPQDGGTPKDPVKNPLSKTWEIRFSRLEKPLESLCGPSATDPNIHALKYWQAETDPDLWDKFQYRDPKKKEPVTLSDASQKIAQKMKKGTVARLCFYPTVTCTEIYDEAPFDLIGKSLAKLEAPDKFAGTAKAWLVVGDDLTEDASGKWTRVTVWQGADNWDEDLYGPNAMEEIKDSKPVTTTGTGDNK